MIGKDKQKIIKVYNPYTQSGDDKVFNPSKLFKLKGTWESFATNHPKFINFMGALRNNYITEGTVIEITVNSSDGRTISSNIKLTEEDIKMFSEISELLRQ